MEPLISVIFPIFNMGAYLSRCVDSVLINTYENLQILCVYDSSTVSSAEVLRQYVAKGERFTMITKGNGGRSSARNADFDLAGGDYVSLIYIDDFVHLQFFRADALSADSGVLGANLHGRFSDGSD